MADAPNAAVQEPPADPSHAPGPSDPVQTKLKELETALKERDAKIQDLETTRATLETRLSGAHRPDPAPQQNPPSNDQEAHRTQERIQAILEKSLVDPAAAAKEMNSLLADVTTQASRSAVIEAQRAMTSQKTIETLRSGVKSSHPEFDDEVVDLVMERANALATTGRFKTAEDAVKEAAKQVREKFDRYATSKNAVPPLPPAANAETGHNPSPEKPKTEKVEEPSEWLQKQQSAKQKKIL